MKAQRQRGPSLASASDPPIIQPGMRTFSAAVSSSSCEYHTVGCDGNHTNVASFHHCKAALSAWSVLAEAYVALQRDLHGNRTHGTASGVTWILQRNGMTVEIADGVLPLAKMFSVMHHHAGERTTDATHCLAACKRPLAWHFWWPRVECSMHPTAFAMRARPSFSARRPRSAIRRRPLP